MSDKEKSMQKEKDIGNRVTRFPDGKYRWIYEMNMLRNPTILVDTYKVLGISFGIVWLFCILLIGCSDGLDLEAMANVSTVFLILMGVFLVIGLLAYLIMAWYYGWKYVAIFTLDEYELIHQQMPSQVKKTKVLGALTVLAGLVSGKPGVVGTGILSSSRSSATSELPKVKRLIGYRRLNLIKVNELLFKNRVYVPKEDFDFVFDYLCQHCPQAKKKIQGRLL